MAKLKPCTIEGCPYDKKAGHPTWCYWHWIARQPAGKQSDQAAARLKEAQRVVGFIDTARVNADLWPAGERWCSGCQGMVPLFYTSGSRCKGCASRASHASHIKRTYGLEVEVYERLLRFQGGRCYVCGQVPRSQRLAVDHDHETGVVRGLLCANDEFGCNFSLRRILGDVTAARRLLEYVEKAPLQRMLDGEGRSENRPVPTTRQKGPGILALTKAWEPPTEVPASVPESAPAAPGASDWQSDPSWQL